MHGGVSSGSRSSQRALRPTDTWGRKATWGINAAMACAMTVGASGCWRVLWPVPRDTPVGVVLGTSRLPRLSQTTIVQVLWGGTLEEPTNVTEATATVEHATFGG